MNINREILRLSIPAVVSNITVPLLGLCDTAISGHLGAVSFLGAIAVGAMMVNPVFWLFGFLRMGTSGLTAQAFGAKNTEEQRRLFSQSLVLAFGIGLILWLLRQPLGSVMEMLMDADAEVSTMATDYFRTLMYAAPALLGTTAISGWMLGMQNTVRPMAVAIGVNAVNIPMSLMLVFWADMGFHGIALGTVIADWAGFIAAILLSRPLLKGKSLWSGWKSIVKRGTLGKFFRVNTDILLRSACIMAVSVAMTAFSARLGALTLAANAVMLQYFHLFSYFMDGLAFTGEALCGRFAGAADSNMLRSSVRHLLLWGLVLTVFFTLLYGIGAEPVASLLTSQTEVVERVGEFWYWVAAIPLVSVWAFIFDGIYIGLTATRRMLLATFAAAMVFFTVTLLNPLGGAISPTDTLWTAFLGYLLTRGVVLAGLCPRLLKKYNPST